MSSKSKSSKPKFAQSAPRLKIDPKHLVELKKYRAEAQLMEAELGSINANFNLLVTKILLEHRCDIKQFAFCMQCGVIHRIDRPKCACK